MTNDKKRMVIRSKAGPRRVERGESRTGANAPFQIVRFWVPDWAEMRIVFEPTFCAGQ